MSYNILLVDDEDDIRELVAKYLIKEGFQVSQTSNGQEALEIFAKNSFDLIILDIMMEGMDGFEVLKRIRAKDQVVHVIFLSAKDMDYNKILGFGLGADDFITKPFIPGELIARVKSQLRRNDIIINNSNLSKHFLKNSELIKCGIFEININLYKAFKNGQAIDLSAKELKLLMFFLKNPNRVFTKKQIYENVWEDEYFDDNTLMVYIRHLREKIEDNPSKPQFITTVWGIGYKFLIDLT